MIDPAINPFDPASDPDRHYIWQRLIVVDTDAFVAGDWAMIDGDFDTDHFEGVRCGNSANPDDWKVAFPRLENYRDSWLAAAREFAAKKFVGMTAREAVLRRTRLAQIDINGDRALAHKKFSGTIKHADGTTITGSRQTIYRLHKQRGVWKIVGFFGQLPLDGS